MRPPRTLMTELFMMFLVWIVLVVSCLSPTDKPVRGKWPADLWSAGVWLALLHRSLRVKVPADHIGEAVSLLHDLPGYLVADLWITLKPADVVVQPIQPVQGLLFVGVHRLCLYHRQNQNDSHQQYS